MTKSAVKEAIERQPLPFTSLVSLDSYLKIRDRISGTTAHAKNRIALDWALRLLDRERRTGSSKETDEKVLERKHDLE